MKFIYILILLIFNNIANCENFNRNIICEKSQLIFDVLVKKLNIEKQNIKIGIGINFHDRNIEIYSKYTKNESYYYVIGFDGSVRRGLSSLSEELDFDSLPEMEILEKIDPRLFMPMLNKIKESYNSKDNKIFSIYTNNREISIITYEYKLEPRLHPPEKKYYYKLINKKWIFEKEEFVNLFHGS